MQTTADIFMDQGRQAIRLPEGIDLSGKEVVVYQNDRTGGITLFLREKRTELQRQASWDEFFRLLKEVPQEELDKFEIPRDSSSPVVRDALR